VVCTWEARRTCGLMVMTSGSNVAGRQFGFGHVGLCVQLCKQVRGQEMVVLLACDCALQQR